MFKLCEGSNIIQLKTKTYPYKNLHDYIKNNNEKCKHLIEYIGGSFFIKQKLKIHKNEIFFSEKELKYFKKKFTFFDKEYAIINPTGKNSYTFVKSWGEKKYQKLVDILKLLHRVLRVVLLLFLFFLQVLILIQILYLFYQIQLYQN